ncbi:MAG: hypothetical protein M0Z34_03700 [Nitrospiraceae bacterium]|nr:hypothetical protein [Nitrospiraceae bacterium]MDA8208311.1 hypothetical protein [Actinomycetota bacterium]
MTANQPAYVVLLLAHATAALIGFGSVALSGYYARRLGMPGEEAERFFSAKRTVSRSMVWLTGILGLALLLLNHRSARLASYPWLRIVVLDYLAAAAFVAMAIWPLEARIREALASGAEDMAKARAAGARLVKRSLVSDLALVLAAVLMVTQPGR